MAQPSCFSQSCDLCVSLTSHHGLSVVVQANCFLLALEQSLGEKGEEDSVRKVPGLYQPSPQIRK